MVKFNNKDEAVVLPNARIFATVYFTLLAILATIAVNALFYLVGTTQFIPFYQSMLLSVGLSAFFGAIFGERIIHCEAPYHRKVFWLGFGMVFAAMPFYVLGFLFLWLRQEHNALYYANSASDIIKLYFFMMFYCVILSTIWMALAAGLAAQYLRGYLVYYALHTDKRVLNIDHSQDIPSKKRLPAYALHSSRDFHPNRRLYAAKHLHPLKHVNPLRHHYVRS